MKPAKAAKLAAAERRARRGEGGRAARARARRAAPRAAARHRAPERAPSSAAAGEDDERSKPFLFLSARPEVEAVGPEYESVRRAMGVDAGRLEHVRLDVDPLGDLAIDAYAGIVVGGSPFNVTTPEAGKHEVQRRVEADLARLAEQSVDGRLPAALHLLRHRRADPAARRRGRHELRRAGPGRRDPAHRRRRGRPAGRGAARAVRRARRAQGGHRAAAGRRRAARLVGRMPRADLPGRRRVYATQFHPEVSTADFIARAQVYRHHGYFPASELREVGERLAAASVTEPQRMLRRFAELADATARLSRAPVVSQYAGSDRHAGSTAGARRPSCCGRE